MGTPSDSSRVYQALRASRSRLVWTLDTMQAELRGLEEKRAALAEEIEGIQALVDLGQEGPNGEVLRGADALEVVKAILRDAGASMHRDDIWSAFQERGFQYSSRAAFMTLLRNYSKEDTSPLYRDRLEFGLNSDRFPPEEPSAEEPSEEERMMMK